MGVLHLRTPFWSPACFQPSFSFLGGLFLQALGTDSAHQSQICLVRGSAHTQLHLAQRSIWMWCKCARLFGGPKAQGSWSGTGQSVNCFGKSQAMSVSDCGHAVSTAA